MSTFQAIESPDADEARSEGHQAARQGLSFNACPYAYQTPMRTAWLDGYRLAIHSPRRAADFRSSLG